ncbi:MAG: hypothetical protein JWO82_2638, partial [Akkermansiaceae bacterium]|nr:hypothetical protein [Akkermansiaceae bacterium]
AGMGWLLHLQRLSTSIQWDWSTIALSLLALAGGGVIAHRLAGRWAAARGGNVPRAGATVKVIAVVLCCCAGAIATSGVIHQLVWLSQKPVRIYADRATARTAMVNQLRRAFLDLREFSEAHGRLPRHLAELAIAKPECHGHLSAPTERDQDSVEPFIYLRPEGALDEITPSTPILLGRIPEADQVCILRADGSVSIQTRLMFEHERPQYQWPTDTP